MILVVAVFRTIKGSSIPAQADKICFWRPSVGNGSNAATSVKGNSHAK